MPDSAASRDNLRSSESENLIVNRLIFKPPFFLNLSDAKNCDIIKLLAICLPICLPTADTGKAGRYKALLALVLMRRVWLTTLVVSRVREALSFYIIYYIYIIKSNFLTSSQKIGLPFINFAFLKYMIN